VAVRIDADGAGCELAYDRAAIDEPTMAGVGAGLARFLESAAVAPDSRLADLPLTSEAEQARLVRPATTAGATGLDTIQARFEAQVERTPDDVALVCDGLALTYSDLNRRANQVAHHLRSLGIGPESLVGVCVTRSTNMLVSLLGVLKAGGAYVPLDPSYPTARLALMLEDAAAPVIVTERRVRTTVPTTPARVVEIDGDWPVVMAQPTDNPPPLASGANLAYVIFTSGSTGRPKGVMVEHRNVLNFFDGLEGRFDTRPGTWLAVTSISFDISVQELFWPITRGFTVVLYTGSEREASTPHPTPATTAAPLDFSLFYFASDEESQGREKYKLLLDGARFADQHGFAAVWTPERHFHAFGGLYPNPSVVSAALAVITSRIQIRGGSVVLPLHTPVRVAEEWALVDNLSSGRVGIAFAAGWQSNDFVLRPESYADRKAVMLRDVEIVRRLWRGETLTLPDGSGKPVTIQTLPRPVQAELPVWLTAAGNPETFRIAGEIGAGVLTHLLGQTFDEVGQKIRLYRDAWQAAGRSGQGHVTLMLHTFVGEDTDAVREIVRQPFTAYLATALDLVRNAPAQFPTHQPPSGAQAAHLDRGMREATEEDLDALLAFAFERYFETSALLGSVDRCVEIADAVRALGADEVGCLIDYGVHPAVVLPSLRHLDTVRRRMQAAATPAPADASVAGLITRHRVSHLQCTPSMARMLLSDAESRVAVGALGTWLIGGEALPPSLADDATSVARLVLNMYGPTETTIWSTSASVRRGERVTIGTPLANQQVVVLSRHGQLLPAGIPGELCIGGAGVVRGYLHRPDLTAERFVAPRAMAPVGRLYRTGDLGRLRPDGQIEFLGRLDHQIKIRGYRVELGEIEAILADHPLVREAIVVAREDTPGHERLVGYIVPRSTPGPTASELKAHVEARLPDFMVPSAFLDLDALPLTPNGKVDRAALPPPERSRPDRHDGYVAPKSELERSIAVVLARALHVEHVGVDDNFFDLGAHSLLMVQVHSELQELLGRPLSLISLFRFPTVSALAAHLSNDDTGDAPGLTRSAERADRRRESLARRQQLRRSAGRA
jgi:natural product biosynthesis luciferase-like monooxygenase protein